METVFQTAWQPITPRGVGRFAHASAMRLLAVQLVFALLAAAAVTWCVRRAWFPVVEEAVQKLPDSGEVRSGRLGWVGPSPHRLAEGRFLALVVDLNHSGDLRGAAHISIELGATSVRVFSLLGYVDLPYPTSGVVALNRSETLPWWGAWSPAILAGLFMGTVVALMVSWAGLALVYSAPAWLLGFFTNRAVDLRGAWRLCGAAQMPGALCMAVAVASYGLGLFDPVRLLVAFAAHLAVSWFYVVVSPLTLPSASIMGSANPFASGGGENAAPARTQQNENPFHPGQC